MKKYVVTIARQFGSLGRPIAQKMSEILGVEYYDRDIVDAVAKKLDLPVSVVSNEEETAANTFSFMMYPLGKSTSDVKNSIFDAQRQIILDFADRESCILVGRCSDFILKEHKNIVKIFIYAPYEERYKNCIDTLHMSSSEAKKMIASVDKARDRYHMNFAKYLPGDYNHMDLMINSSLLGEQGTAEYLAGLIKMKFA